MQIMFSRSLPATYLVVLLLIQLPGPASAADAWPSKVSAAYKVTFNGFEIGRFQFESTVNARSYVLDGSAELSALLGIFKWQGTTHSSGTIVGEQPKPALYAFDYKSSSKTGAVTLSFNEGRVASTKVVPPNKPSKEAVPVEDQHLKDVLDPLTAIMALSRSKGENPCGRKVSIFDGKQRFDLLFSFRRQLKVAEMVPSGQPEVGIVCSVRYVPIAGHKPHVKSSISPGDSGIEVAFRPIPSANLFVPYNITIPTLFGSAVLTAQRVDIVAPGMKQIALVH
jgi:hypothetical protein